MLKYDGYRTGISDTPLCDCGMAVETIEHFLLYCSKYDTERQDMMAYIEDTGYGIMNNERFCIFESLLLAPSPDNVSIKDNTIIKAALFQFLEKSQRNVRIIVIVHFSFDLAEIHLLDDCQSVIVDKFTVSLLQPDQDDLQLFVLRMYMEIYCVNFWSVYRMRKTTTSTRKHIYIVPFSSEPATYKALLLVRGKPRLQPKLGQ